MKLPRFLHCIYANLTAHFWLTCPLCGKNFGGHEWKTSLQTDYGPGIGICPDCNEKAERQNDVFWKDVQENCYIEADTGKIVRMTEEQKKQYETHRHNPR